MCHWKVLFWTCHQRNSNRIFILITVIFHVCHKIITCYVIYWFTVIFVDPALVVCHNFVYRYPFSLYSDIFFYRKHLFGFSNLIKSMLTGFTILLKQTFICNREKRCGVQCDRFVFFYSQQDSLAVLESPDIHILWVNLPHPFSPNVYQKQEPWYKGRHAFSTMRWWVVVPHKYVPASFSPLINEIVTGLKMLLRAFEHKNQ